MNGLLDVPVSAITSLSAERAVVVVRAVLRSECGYARLSPAALTISSRLTVADGGIDAEVNVPEGTVVPADCIFRPGLTGFQIKSGMTFKPWTPSAIRGELLDGNGKLYTEVARLVARRGRYLLLCTGHDLTPEQRNDSQQLIVDVLAEVGFPAYHGLVEVLGASQLVEFAERYPGTASLLALDPIQEAWVLEEWQRDAHMANAFESSPEQTQLVDRIRTGLLGEAKHFRILGEPGLGKTRIVLEAVRGPDIAPYVLYVQHGSRFGQTKLFRQLLRAGWNKPLVLILDELPESELSDIWRHLKPRCGSLRIVSLDHGRDETHDEDIDRLNAPRLPDETIKKILANTVGKSRDLDRWVAICEGSPRVAQAVAENLCANPGDLLRPPATVPIWARFLHGYGTRDDGSARQVDCVTQHLALFSRFGYEEPVADEAAFVSRLLQRVDPTVGWARFQEIIQSLRARRVLQGSRTLFFVPKALHIYLWKQFWERYGRGFDFTQTFGDMPASLHMWFMSMFKFAGDAATAHVIDDILRSDGIFSDRTVLTSAKGSRFLSTLAEANSGAVLRLLEATIGTWNDHELLDFKQERQNLVWALAKIAVWPAFTVRAIQVLARLAVNENADFSNNSTGTLVELFRIGPEAAATEAAPEARLPALLKLLRAPLVAERLLGLKAVRSALESRGTGFRIVGPEYQGLKERAKLWMPATYGQWHQAQFGYFQALVDETRDWPSNLRVEVCQALLDAVEQQIRTPPCTELAFQVLNVLVDDGAMSSRQLNRFFWHWEEYGDGDRHSAISRRLKAIASRYARRSLASRVQRYVVDVDWMEWHEEYRERHNKPKSRANILVNGLARRIARNPATLGQVEHLLAPKTDATALWHFGEQLARSDDARALLPALTRLTLETRHQVCLHGYLSGMQVLDFEFYISWVTRALHDPTAAWLGAEIALRSNYVDGLFVLCLEALQKRWIEPEVFAALRYGKAIESVPPERTGDLFRLINERDTERSMHLLVELLDSMSLDDTCPFASEFVFGVVLRTVPGEQHEHQMSGFHWKSLCLKLVKWDASRAFPLLDALLTAMGKSYQLTYDSNVAPLANELARLDSNEAWRTVSAHLERELPQWRGDLLSWLKGGMATFDEKEPNGAIVDLPVSKILEWIERESAPRAVLMAHAAPRTLDDDHGGTLTRALLVKFGQIDGVRNGISATFQSGGWTGPTSAHLKRKRERFRRWLAAGFEFEVTQWIESEIEYLDRSIEREEIEEERSRFD